MPNRATWFSSDVTGVASATLAVTEAPGVAGGTGPSETVIDNLVVAIKVPSGGANYIIRWRDDTTTIIEHYVYVGAGEAKTFTIPYAGGFRSSSDTLNCYVVKDTGTDATLVRVTAEYHYE